ncbi:SRPBCC family protein [Arthrobacter sp. NPDC089319]|uniref:SRPBCC family protein n=1 Tax=Arthrobacter sp. NPDC089319 TaxID=3155915 RepID=UPI003446BB92
MGHHLELVQHVNAPAEAVWRVLTDIPGSARTLSSISRIEIMTPGDYAEGYRWRETRKMMGKEATEEMWVAEVVAPTSTTVKAKSNGADYTTRFTLAPAEGGTRLTMFFGAEMESPGALAKVMLAVFGKLAMGITRKQMARDL